ncbi:hypothetical protein LL999_26125 [Burkholderia ambifaria]|uniref:hypothetical protein n=1 Tax=Burkholderia ambifaria TaxID=152480 RepID=UPI001E4D7DD3|nr:hypothetical protein [Burkholderia ambifaria]UEP23702.1 hypothetical protein LL999_26125 [Burkholderia ambifaria]
MGKAVDRMCVGGESANMPAVAMPCSRRADGAPAVASKPGGRGPAQAGRTSISRGDAEPVYYLKITLRTARFAEHRNATVSRDRLESRRVAQHRTSGRVYREKNIDG